VTIGANSHAEGAQTTAIGGTSHAEGQRTKAEGEVSHAEGIDTIALGRASHAEGEQTIAEGINSHTEGTFTHASHYSSHASGYFTKTGRNSQTVCGEYNAGKSHTLFEVGNGTQNINRNAFEVLEDGRAAVYGAPIEDNDVVRKQDLDAKTIDKIDYLGTIASVTELSTTCGRGDFYRASTSFTLDGTSVHVGDLLIALKDNPSQNLTDWDILHTEMDKNTWNENTKDADGYVKKGGNNFNSVWMTDNYGNPAWRTINYPQSDYLQNDSTSESYIKNRPFYSEDVSKILFNGAIELSAYKDENGVADGRFFINLITDYTLEDFDKISYIMFDGENKDTSIKYIEYEDGFGYYGNPQLYNPSISDI
jgi:hypothetical protein